MPDEDCVVRFLECEVELVLADEAERGDRGGKLILAVETVSEDDVRFERVPEDAVFGELADEVHHSVMGDSGLLEPDLVGDAVHEIECVTVLDQFVFFAYDAEGFSVRHRHGMGFVNDAGRACDGFLGYREVEVCDL